MNANEQEAREPENGVHLRTLALLLSSSLLISFPGIAQEASPPAGLTLSTALTPPPAGGPSSASAAMPSADVALSAPITSGHERKPEPDSANGPGDTAPLLKLGPGDMIAMQVYGRPELNISTYVSDNGAITVPLAGAVQVGNLSPNEAAEKIASAYRSGGYLLQPQINLTLQQFRSQQISVLGEVRTPGRYSLESRTSIFDLLAQAGGASTDAADTIYLLRQGDKGQILRIPVTMQDLIKRSSSELALRGGDSIYVPKAPQFYIYGEVKSPNRYRLDTGMTVVQAIAMGGGITDRGSDRRVEIRRRSVDGTFKTFDARATDTVEADDVIRIKERIF